MSNKKISVVIPVYNVERYIGLCLDSVINQTYKNLEIICVNDGSTDESLKIIEEYQEHDNRIKIINQENRGLSAARNTGIKQVTGDYIAFLDSDDWVEEDFYEKLYNACENNNADVSIGLTCYYYNNQNIQTDRWVNQHAFANKNNIVETIEDRQNIIYSCACWNKIYKTELIKKNNLSFPEGLNIEDVPFTFAISILANKLVKVPEAKIFYRQQPDSIMQKASSTRLPFCIFKIYEVCENFLESLKINGEIKKQYKQILENFEIFNIYAWFGHVNKIFRKEFKTLMRNKFKQINIKNNPYISQKSEEIYNSVIIHNFERKLKNIIKSILSQTL